MLQNRFVCVCVCVFFFFCVCVRAWVCASASACAMAGVHRTQRRHRPGHLSIQGTVSVEMVCTGSLRSRAILGWRPHAVGHSHMQKSS